MDIQAIMQQLDSLYSSGNRDNIEEFMIATREEAARTGDWSARIMIQNEMIGFYRTTGDFNTSYQLFTETLDNFRELGLVGTLPYTGTLLNGATMLRAAGYPDRALELFEEVRNIYEDQLSSDDYRLAGLYNNLGLVYMDRKDYNSAEKYLLKTEGIIEKLPDSRIEQATTLTTLANISMSRHTAVHNTANPILKEEQKATEKSTEETGQAVMKGKQDNISSDITSPLISASQYLKKADSLFATVNYQDPHYAAYLSALAQYQILTKDLKGAVETYRTALNVIERYHGRNRNYQIVQQNLEYLEKKVNL